MPFKFVYYMSFGYTQCVIAVRPDSEDGHFYLGRYYDRLKSVLASDRLTKSAYVTLSPLKCKYRSLMTIIVSTGSFFSSSFVTMAMLWSMGASISTSVCPGCFLFGLTLDLLFLMVVCVCEYMPLET